MIIQNDLLTSENLKKREGEGLLDDEISKKK